ncbi:hypothetical protein NBRC116598_38870 [Pseudophaeobacter arcticus]|uniref:Uncharacterized protein n=1 Tax=Pseudophaeobacter arcticus TaxID=385492 RepID=A0ABQ0ARC5_9RHOB
MGQPLDWSLAGVERAIDLQARSTRGLGDISVALLWTGLGLLRRGCRCHANLPRRRLQGRIAEC